MPKMIDGRKYWTQEEGEFLTDPANLRTKADHAAAREYHETRDVNYLIDCILSDRNPLTGKSISEEEQEVYERWLGEGRA